MNGIVVTHPILITLFAYFFIFIFYLNLSWLKCYVYYRRFIHRQYSVNEFFHYFYININFTYLFIAFFISSFHLVRMRIFVTK